MTEYRTSKYNIYEKVKTGWALFNGLTGAIDLTDEQTKELLCTGQWQQLPEEEIACLKNRGYLSDPLKDQEMIEQVTEELERTEYNEFGITFLITYNCNFRCPYCFEKQRLRHGEDWLEKIMTPEQVDRCYYLAENDFFQRKMSTVVLFGGEPLMPQTKATVERILKGAEERKLREVYIITNGYYLDEFIPMLQEYPMVKMQITLDGLENTHNKRRFLKGGGESYQRICDNITNGLKAGLRIDIRMNVDKGNEADVEKLRQKVGDYGWTAYPGFYFYTSATQYPGRDAEVEEDLSLSLYITFRKAVWGHERLAMRNYCCSAENLSWIVDPYDDVYSCFEMTGKREWRTGRLTEEGMDLEGGIGLDLLCRKSNLMKKCRDCPNIFVCGGGCAHMAAMKGDMKEASCGSMPVWIRKAIAKSVNEYTDKHEDVIKKLEKKHLADLTDTFFP